MTTDKIDLEIENTVGSLKKGHVIVYPTDTIWGIGCDCMNEAAIERVYFIKNRDRHKPMILLVDCIAMLKTYVPRLHPRIETLLVHHRQPLTLIHKHTANLPDYVLSSDGTIGIRICMDPFCSEIIEKFGRPIISTSANISSDPFPQSFEDINPKLLQKADYICNHRRNEVIESAPSVIATYNSKGDLDFIRE